MLCGSIAGRLLLIPATSVVDCRIYSEKMVAKGVPTARSQRYKAMQKVLQEKKSVPQVSSSDVLPPPIQFSDNPIITQDDEAQRAFTTVRRACNASGTLSYCTSWYSR
jgi:hypothetical protein